MASHLLSKSSYIKGLQCEKHLYLYKYHYDEMDELSEMQKSIFKRGIDVGVLAQQLFPGGIDASAGVKFNYDKCVKITKEEIGNGSKIIYEAGFLFDEVLAIADIIIKDKNGWNIYEVKSSTSVSETYINDAALQYYVLKGWGLKIKSFNIIYINNQYVRKGDLNLKELFTIEPVLSTLTTRQKDVVGNVKKLKAVLVRKTIPQIEIGEHCHNPYTCSYFNYCRKHIPQNSVFDFSGMHLSKKYELYDEGVIDLDDVPGNYPLNSNNKLQLESYKSGKTIVDFEGIKNFLSDLKYPFYFLDFESFQSAVPLYDSTKPYQQVPFQFSVHIQKSEDSDIEHKDFLAEAGEDPRPKFIKKLLETTKGKGDIIVYNKSFEKGRMEELARDFPEYAEELQKRIERLKDLMIPFQKKYYYAPEMKGSYSIKVVLPALVPEMSYENLEINDGGLATIAFNGLQYETDLMKIAETRQQLLEYCKLDTLAMVKIVDKLELIINGN
jgi:Domain of unknown function(DUF2779)